MLNTLIIKYLNYMVINNRNLYLIVLEVVESKVRVSERLGSGGSHGPDCRLTSYCVLLW